MNRLLPPGKRPDPRRQVRPDLLRDTRPIRRTHARPAPESKTPHLNIPREARFWAQVPTLTKVALVVLGYLIVVLVFLALVRGAQLPVTLRDVRDWFTGPTPTPVGTLTPTPAPTLPPTPTYPATVPWLRANANTPIRGEPSDDAPGLAILEAGETAMVLGVSRDQQYWAIKVPYFEGGQGWVSASQVLVQNATDVPVAGGAPKDVNALPTEQRPVLETTTVVNVRKNPDMNAERLGTLKAGEVYVVTGKSEDGFWYAIKLFDGRTGWVSKDYVTTRNDENIPVVTEAPAAQGTSFPVPDENKPALMATWMVNLRAGPGREYAVVGQMLQNQVAEVLGVSADGKWYAIVFTGTENGKAWVASDYVQTKNVEGVPVLK